MLTTNRIIAAAVVAIILAAGGYFALRPSPQSGSVVQLGAIFPLSGDVASYGKAAQRGIDLAVDEINAADGVKGKSLKIDYEDSRGQSSDAISAIRHLIATINPPVIFGEAPSSATVAIAPIANENQIVLFSPISSTEELTQKGGPYFFRMCPSDGVQARLMAAWIHDDGHNKTAVIYITNSWGDSLRQEFTPAYTSTGGQIVDVEGIAEGTRDLRTVLTKVKASGADALYGITYGIEGGALLRQAKELGLTIQIYGADVWGSPELKQNAGEAAQGVRIIVPSKFAGPGYDAFSKKFHDRYGIDPDVYASYSYDMVHITANALALADRGPKLRDEIRATKYQGVTGLTSFDEHGNDIGKSFSRVVLSGSD
jgi:branched-chain amino acid transport system substrate-binding protein